VLADSTLPPVSPHRATVERATARAAEGHASKLCISVHLIILCISCIAFMLVAHGCTFAIDPAEQGRVEPPEPAPVETADYEQDQGRP
jgi:hypothetical protein